MAEDRTGVVARLDALEAAHKGATPGPWRWEGDRYDASIWAGPETPREAVPVCTSPDWGPVDAADAAAIVAEHNAFPELLAAVRGVLALADEWKRRAAQVGPCDGYGVDDTYGAAARSLYDALAAALGEA